MDGLDHFVSSSGLELGGKTEVFLSKNSVQKLLGFVVVEVFKGLGGLELKVKLDVRSEQRTELVGL